MNLCAWLVLAGWFFLKASGQARISEAQFQTTAQQLVDKVAADPEASQLLQLTVAPGSENRIIKPIQKTFLRGGEESQVVATAAEVAAAINGLEEEDHLISATASADPAALLPAQVQLRGGGDGFEILSTASSVVAALTGHATLEATLTGPGSAPVQELPRTQLRGGEPAVLSTATQVVAALAGHPILKASGSGSTPLLPMDRTWLEGNVARTTYEWNSENRLTAVKLPNGTRHEYAYDHRARRISAARSHGPEAAQQRAVVFAGGLSLAEYESTGTSSTAFVPTLPTVHYVRGPDMGGGVGGLLYSIRASGMRYNLSNGRGDIVAQSDEAAALTWTASYEAYGKRRQETGVNADRQRANTKDEDPTGLLNEGFRYRDLETGVWLSRDPAGFVDGPNLYAYVKQNPWTKFDPLGLAEDEITRKSGVGHHKAPFADTKAETRFSTDVKRLLNGDSIKIDNLDVKLNSALIPTSEHNAAGHPEYTKRYQSLKNGFIDKAKKIGLNPAGTAKEAMAFAQELLKEVDNSPDDYIRGFNNMVRDGKSPREISAWGKTFLQSERAAAAGVLSKAKGVGTKALGIVGLGATVLQAKDSVNEYKEDVANGATKKEALRTQYYRWGSISGSTPEEQRINERKFSDSFFNWLSPPIDGN